MVDSNNDQRFKVTIQDQFSKELPFPTLEARNVVVLIICYFGFIEDVLEFFQKASHKTRAFIISLKGLKNLLTNQPGAIQILREVRERGELDSIARY